MMSRTIGRVALRENDAGCDEVAQWSRQVGRDVCDMKMGGRWMMQGSKTIRVVAAVICDSLESRTRIFAVQRGTGAFKGGWEFPGGKIEVGELPREALVREIAEELEVEIRVGALIETVEYEYPEFHLSMDCFWAELVKGEPRLNEHRASRWLTADELLQVDWLPADQGLAGRLRTMMGKPV